MIKLIKNLTALSLIKFITTMTQATLKGYKQTRVGIIPEDWKVKKLGNICKRITTGKLDANAMKKEGKYRFYTCAKDHYYIDKYAFDTEALLISGNGANVGYIHYYKGKFNAYQRTYVLSDFKEDIFFTKLLLDKNLKKRIRAEVNAGNTPYIKMSTLTEMSIAYPKNRAEQTAIATVLSDTDALIKELEKLIVKKKAVKQGAMQQLLTGKKRLPGFSGEWKVKKLEKFDFDISDGNYSSKYPKASEFKDRGIPFIRANNIKNLRITGNDLRFISSRLHSELTKGHLKRGDILVTTRGEIGQVAIVPDRHINSNINAQIVRINTGKELNKYYFAYFLIKAETQKSLLDMQTGSALKQLPVGRLKKLKIIYPSLLEQTAIATILSDMDTEIEALEKSLLKYRQIKAGMMQQLLTGKIRLIKK